jgi:hypothetical protein
MGGMFSKPSMKEPKTQAVEETQKIEEDAEIAAQRSRRAELKGATRQSTIGFGIQSKLAERLKERLG